MLLAYAEHGQVVRNSGNHNHYRFDRPEKSRVRIRPLELFPSGLLVAKPTDTLVSPDIDVVVVGMWVEGMRVEGKPNHGREAYERELEACKTQLAFLEEQYELLPVNGKGKESRGSWANKLKNCRQRIVTLELGLADPVESTKKISAKATVIKWQQGQPVLLPSGRLGVVDRAQSGLAKVTCMVQGQAFTANLPTEVLQPIRSAYATHA